MNWLLLLCLILIGILVLAVASLSFQLWLSRRDARILQRVPVMQQAIEPDGQGGCANALLIPAILIVLLFILGGFVW